ncbi:MAG TPA: hypothetical protein VK203_10765 [Nostocaceae cyanobacterium]|nr:hypothetical protein [Nostocaceae cyanobacterium]
MAIRIPPKFGSKLSPEQPDPNQKRGVDFAALSAKLNYNNQYIKPLLGDLFPLYRDKCEIHDNAGQRLPKEWGWYSREDSKGEYTRYDRIGEILAQIDDL